MLDFLFYWLHSLYDIFYSNIGFHFMTLYYYTFLLDSTTIISIKIALCLMFLIVIRGCIPRYRYDFLTKIGWVKFLAYVLSFLLLSIFLYLVW